MIRTRITCGACHQSVTIRGEVKNTIDSPFVLCPWCHNLVLDDSKEEWNTMNGFIKFLFIVGVRTFFIVVLFGLPLSITLASGLGINPGFGFLFYPIIVGGILGSKFGIKYTAESFQDAIKASNERLKDPKYREALIKAGFKIYNLDEILKEDSTEDDE